MGIKIILGIILRFILAAVGLMFLSCGSFSQNQFQDDANWKAMFFISFTLSVAVFVYMPRKCNVMLQKLCKMHFFMKALVKFLLLGLYSMLIFFTKYPRFKFHSGSDGQQQLIKQGHGNQNDLYGIGSFSVLAVVISWEGQHQTEEFGVFEFLLELTMDASMDIQELDGRPNLRYMVGAYVSCFLLLIVQSCRCSSVSGRPNDCVDRQETCLELPEMGFSAEADRRRCESESIIRVVETREGMLDGQTIEEDGHEADGLRRRKRKTDQEIRSSFESRCSEGEGPDEELSNFEVWLMEARLAKAQLVLPKSEWELHCGRVRENFMELQKLLGGLDRALTSTVSHTCKIM